MYARVQAAFSHPKATWLTVLLSLVLGGVSVVSGLAADDHVHQLVVSGSHALRGVAADRLDVFRFATPETTPILMNDGVFPWWADPQLNFGFWRPLSSLSHLVDHLLWPSSPGWMHVHTLFWHALGLWGLWALYRRLLGPSWVAVLALFLYGLDDARGGPLTWVANRHAVLGATLSIATLLCHHRAREASARRVALSFDGLALALFGLALLASQGSVSACGYLFAHACFLERDALPRRFARLLPYALAVVVWAVVSRSLGYGIHGSDVYADPLGDPLWFARLFLERGPILWLAQLAAPWSEVWNLLPLFAPWLMPLLFALALAVLAAWGKVLAPLWRTDPTTRFFVVGAALSTLPAAAAWPADRLLGWVAIGASGFVAQFFGRFVEVRRQTTTSRLESLLALSVLVLHLGLGPLLLPGRAVGTLSTRRTLDLADHSVPATADVVDKTVVLVNPPSDAHAGYIAFRRAADRVPRPARIRWLATSLTEVSVERLDARTLRVTQAGGFQQAQSEQLLRSPRHPLRVGELVELDGFSVEITATTPDGRPLEVKVRFAEPLESPRYLWLMWQGRGFVPFRVPQPGERVVLPAFDPIQVALG
jgi:hypothetical protein